MDITLNCSGLNSKISLNSINEEVTDIMYQIKMSESGLRYSMTFSDLHVGNEIENLGIVIMENVYIMCSPDVTLSVCHNLIHAVDLNLRL